MLEKNIEEIIRSTGEDINREGLKGTPKRVVDSYATIFSGYKMNPQDILTIFDDENYDQMIISKDIEFYSTCEHHLLPFFGKAHIGYIPNGRILGLSKFARLTEIFSRRLQTQENLTNQIVNTLEKHLRPRGLIVNIEAEHLCISMRGVKKSDCLTKTTAVRGILENKTGLVNRFYREIGRKGKLT